MFFFLQIVKKLTIYDIVSHKTQYFVKNVLYLASLLSLVLNLPHSV